jgi:hypothetical protein
LYGEFDCTTAANYTPAQWAVLGQYINISDRVCAPEIASAEAVGVTSGTYTDPTLPCTATSTTSCYSFNEASNYSSASWARTCGGAQIYLGDPSDGHNTRTNPGARSLVTDFQNYAVLPFKQAGGQFILADNLYKPTADGEYTGRPGGTPVSGSAAWCNYTDATWIANYTTFFSALSLPVMYNGDTEPDLAAITASPQVKWGMCEDCLSFGFNESADPGRLKERPPFWQNELGAGLVTMGNGKSWFVFTHGYNEPKNNDVQNYVLASLLLIYEDGKTGWMMDGDTKSGINTPVGVYFVPTQPLVASNAITSIESLNVGGAYVREYAACYLYGKSVGACAAVVNPNPSGSVPMPKLSRAYAGSVSIDNWCGTASAPSNLGGSYCYKGATTQWGDTGSVSIVPAVVPAVIPPAEAYIFTQNAKSGGSRRHHTRRRLIQGHS